MVLVFICAEFDIWLENITLINQIEFAQKFSPISFSVSSLHVFFSSFSILGNKTRLDEGQDFILRRCCCSAYIINQLNYLLESVNQSICL